MKRFTEEQIVQILKKQEAGERAEDVCRVMDLANRRFISGRQSSVAWKSPLPRKTETSKQSLRRDRYM